MTPYNWIGLVVFSALVGAAIAKEIYKKKLDRVRTLLSMLDLALFEDSDPFSRIERSAPILGEMREVVGHDPTKSA